MQKTKKEIIAENISKLGIMEKEFYNPVMNLSNFDEIVEIYEWYIKSIKRINNRISNLIKSNVTKFSFSGICELVLSGPVGNDLCDKDAGGISTMPYYEESTMLELFFNVAKEYTDNKGDDLDPTELDKLNQILVEMFDELAMLDKDTVIRSICDIFKTKKHNWAKKSIEILTNKYRMNYTISCRNTLVDELEFDSAKDFIECISNCETDGVVSDLLVSLLVEPSSKFHNVMKDKGHSASYLEFRTVLEFLRDTVTSEIKEGNNALFSKINWTRILLVIYNQLSKMGNVQASIDEHLGSITDETSDVVKQDIEDSVYRLRSTRYWYTTIFMEILSNQEVAYKCIDLDLVIYALSIPESCDSAVSEVDTMMAALYLKDSNINVTDQDIDITKSMIMSEDINTRYFRYSCSDLVSEYDFLLADIMNLRTGFTNNRNMVAASWYNVDKIHDSLMAISVSYIRYLYGHRSYAVKNRRIELFDNGDGNQSTLFSPILRSDMIQKLEEGIERIKERYDDTDSTNENVYAMNDEYESDEYERDHSIRIRNDLLETLNNSYEAGKNLIRGLSDILKSMYNNATVEENSKKFDNTVLKNGLEDCIWPRFKLLKEDIYNDLLEQSKKIDGHANYEGISTDTQKTNAIVDENKKSLTLDDVTIDAIVKDKKTYC